MKKRNVAVLCGAIAVAVAAGGTLMSVFAVSQSELAQMCMDNEAVVIEVAEPVSQESGEEVSVGWTELASLENYIDFRMDFDDILDITRQGQGGKNGVIYIDAEGNHTNNSTLYYAFMNKKFVEGYWNNNDKVEAIADAARGVYVDVESDQEALYAGLNGYYNLLNDSEPGYANLSSTLTRGEFMAFLMKADTPVYEIEADASFADAVGGGEYVLFAQEMEGHSFLQTADQSLDRETFNGTITRAEAIYMIASRYYGEELGTAGPEASVRYADAKDGGDIALKAGFAVEEKDAETKEMVRTNPPGRYNAYELAYAVQNPDKGMPTQLYNALAVASKHNLIGGTESRWDEGITKGEALALVVRVYEDLAETNGYLTDASRGEAVGDVVGTDVDTEAEADTESQESLGEILASLNDRIDPDVHVDFSGGTPVIDEVMEAALPETAQYIDYAEGWSEDSSIGSEWEKLYRENLETILKAYHDGTVSKEEYYHWMNTNCLENFWPESLYGKDALDNYLADNTGEGMSHGAEGGSTDDGGSSSGGSGGNAQASTNPGGGSSGGSGGGTGGNGGGSGTSGSGSGGESTNQGNNGGYDTEPDPGVQEDWGDSGLATDEGVADFFSDMGGSMTQEEAANTEHIDYGNVVIR